VLHTSLVTCLGHYLNVFTLVSCNMKVSCKRGDKPIAKRDRINWFISPYMLTEQYQSILFGNNTLTKM